jgi:hypothetical protein
LLIRNLLGTKDEKHEGKEAKFMTKLGKQNISEKSPFRVQKQQKIIKLLFQCFVYKHQNFISKFYLKTSKFYFKFLLKNIKILFQYFI